KIQIESNMFTVFIAASEESGGIIKVCQIDMPKDGNATFNSRTDNFPLMREILEFALLSLNEAETMHRQGANSLQ
ncbi:hypothetical protein, partial [Klebsiella pneumoniae]